MNYMNKFIVTIVTVVIAAFVHSFETADEWYNHGETDVGAGTRSCSQ